MLLNSLFTFISRRTLQVLSYLKNETKFRIITPVPKKETKETEINYIRSRELRRFIGVSFRHSAHHPTIRYGNLERSALYSTITRVTEPDNEGNYPTIDAAIEAAFKQQDVKNETAVVPETAVAPEKGLAPRVEVAPELVNHWIVTKDQAKEVECKLEYLLSDNGVNVVGEIPAEVIKSSLFIIPDGDLPNFIDPAHALIAGELQALEKNAVSNLEVLDNYNPSEAYALDRDSVYFLTRFESLRLKPRATLQDLKTNYLVVQAILADMDCLMVDGYVNNTKVLLNSKSLFFNRCCACLITPSNQRILPASELPYWDAKLSTKSRLELLKWSKNLINLKLYDVLIQGIDFMTRNPDESDLFKMLLTDYELLRRITFNMLDPSVREKLAKPTISFIQNIYAGYDTEYQAGDGFNELLSSQLAVSTKTLLSITDRSALYKFNVLSTLGQNHYEVNSYADKVAYKRIEWEIRESIAQIRNLRGGSNDVAIRKLITGLKHQSIPNFTSEGRIVFRFDRTRIRSWLEMTSTSYLVGLVNQVLIMSERDLLKELTVITEMLKSIWLSTTLDNEAEEEESSTVDADETMVNGDDITDYELFGSSSDLEQNFNVKEWISEIDVVDTQINPHKTLNYKAYETMVESMKKNREKLVSTTRTSYTSFTPEKIDVALRKNLYLTAHLTAADFSILTDFEEFKMSLSIVNNRFVTIKPIKILGVSVHIRDTMLLSAPGFQKLDQIGGLYGYQKVTLPIGAITNMKQFHLTDPLKFREYALRDAEITLIHSCYMNDLNFQLGKLGVPLTISQVSTGYVLKYWSVVNYPGYQIHPEFPVGDVTKSITPQGLAKLGGVGLMLSWYIANFKGGRNESFMIGVDESTEWFDYDLKSAYTTAMCLLDHPNYKAGRFIKPSDLRNWSPQEILHSYTIIKGSFTFPSYVKYPSIPVRLDETTTIYPLSGECILTGAELLCAYNQGCRIRVESVYTIPFTKASEKEKAKEDAKEEEVENAEARLMSMLTEVTLPQKTNKTHKIKSKVNNIKPFAWIIQYFWRTRRKYPKNSLMNILIKLMANSGYGQISTGIGNKKRYNVQTRNVTRTEPSWLSNPILASWVTAFIRSVIGELLHAVQMLDGTVVSVTTDGFLTNVQDLENKVVSLYGNKSEFQRLAKNLELRDPAEAEAEVNSKTEVKPKAKPKVEVKAKKLVGNLDEPVIFELLKKPVKSEVTAKEPVKSEVTAKEDVFSLLREFRKVRIDFNHKYPHGSEELSSEQLKELRLKYNDVEKTNAFYDADPAPGLELCKQGKGLLSWSTRGQFGKDRWVSAATGYQLPYKPDLFEDLVQTYKSSKHINYTAFTLTSANKIAKKGGHVMAEYSDRSFWMHYDNRRLIVDSDSDSCNKFLDSKPLDIAEHAGVLRLKGQISKTSVYNKYSSTATGLKKYKRTNEICIRSFLKALFTPALGVSYVDFEKYAGVIDFIKGFDDSISVNAIVLATIKSRIRHYSFTKNQVPRNTYSENFVDYVKTKYPDFVEKDFFKS